MFVFVDGSFERGGECVVRKSSKCRKTTFQFNWWHRHFLNGVCTRWHFFPFLTLSYFVVAFCNSTRFALGGRNDVAVQCQVMCTEAWRQCTRLMETARGGGDGEHTHNWWAQLVTGHGNTVCDRGKKGHYFFLIMQHLIQCRSATTNYCI